MHRFFAEQSMQCELLFYDSQSGEIITKEVKQQTSASKVNVVRVIRDKINLRKEPSSDAEALVRLSSDEDLKVLSIIEDENSYMWYEIDTGKYQGYIRCDLTNVEPDNVQIDNVEGLDRLNKVKNF